VVILAVLGFGFYELAVKVKHVDYKDVKIGSETFKLEVANTEDARIKGLSQRDSLDKNKGMLFDFKSAGDWRIWMIDMHFDIDIAWLDQGGKIVYIKEDATPASYPEIYHASVPNWYVIELPANTLSRVGVHQGDSIKLN
jgi:uncharacterized membrane protein (UPF0127 family)